MTTINNNTIIHPTPSKIAGGIQEFKKPKSFINELQRWFKINKQCPEGTEVIIIPLSVGKKSPHRGDTADGKSLPSVLFKHDYEDSKKWSWKKALSYPWHDADCDLGILINGDIGVLDFDSSEDFDWFFTQFNLSEEDCFVVKS